jgi:ketosteroid isomerase-like protein
MNAPMTSHETLCAMAGDINAAWRAGDFARLASLFHPDMVIVGPAGAVYAQGSAACIESYRAFASQAQILAYEETPPVVHVWADTGVVAYAWTMTYRRDGTTSTESGSDQFVFARCSGQWQVLYRLLTFDAPDAASEAPR